MSNVNYDHGLDKLVREWIFLLGEFKSPTKTGKELNDSLNLGADIFEPDTEYFIEESDRRGDDNVCSITLNQKQYSIFPKGE